MAGRKFGWGAESDNSLMVSARMLEKRSKQRQAMAERQEAGECGLLPRPATLEPPSVPEFAYDDAKIGRTLTVRQLANILTNENRALSGPKLDEGIYAMARAIINRDLARGVVPRRQGVEGDVASADPPRRLSPKEAAQARRNLEIARKAFMDTMLGEPDPVQGSISYNHRDIRDAVPSGGRPPAPRYGEPVLKSYGPLRNAFPTRHVGPQAYITIYESPKRYQNPYERKKR
jgi:hypothetical protein